jgi:hypothetical protein
VTAFNDLALLGPTLDLRSIALEQPNGAVDLRPGGALVDFEVEMTMLGAPNVTLAFRDPAATDMLESGLFDRAVDVQIEGEWFRLARIEAEENLSVTFEARTVARLRKNDEPLKASRGKMTRLQFAATLIRGVPGARLIAPQLNKRQPIAEPDQRARAEARQEREARRDEERQPGFPPANPNDPSLTIKGTPATEEQLRVISDVIDVGQQMAVEPAFIDAAVATVIVEADATNPPFGDRDSVGAFQQRNIAPWNRRDRLNVRQAARSFYEQARLEHAKNPSHGPGVLAADVQHPAKQYEGRYQDVMEDAQRLTGEYGVEQRPDPTISYYQRYEFRRGRGDGERENTWDCLYRLFEDEVEWYRWEHFDRVYLMDDSDLLRSRPRMVIHNGHEALASRLRFTWDPREDQADMTLDARLGLWKAPHGSTVKVVGAGPGSGRWIVQTIRRGAGPIAQVTLIRPRPSLPEPRSTKVTRPVSIGALEDRAAAGPNELSGGLGTDWAGTKGIFDRFVTPFMADRGLTVGSQKRTPAENAAAGGSHSSDHLTTSTRSYAIDYPTANGLGLAKDLADAFGITGWQANSFQPFTITIAGRRFRVQILWGALIGHGDHIHVGILAL